MTWKFASQTFFLRSRGLSVSSSAFFRFFEEKGAFEKATLCPVERKLILLQSVHTFKDPLLTLSCAVTSSSLIRYYHTVVSFYSISVDSGLQFTKYNE